jgi:hypothetical protein
MPRTVHVHAACVLPLLIPYVLGRPGVEGESGPLWASRYDVSHREKIAGAFILWYSYRQIGALGRRGSEAKLGRECCFDLGFWWCCSKYTEASDRTHCGVLSAMQAVTTGLTIAATRTFSHSSGNRVGLQRRVCLAG